MTNKSYWARRMKMLKEGIAQDRAKDVEYIEREYNRTIKEIDGKIRAWYQRIADNNGVSYAKAQRMLSKSELKDFRMTVEEYIEKGLPGGFEKELENASARVHISCLEALEMELQAHAEELTGKRITRTESALKDAYTETYYHTGYEVQQMAGVGVNMRKVDKKRLENVLARPWAADEQTFTARCWTDKQRLVHKLETELTRMVATGAAPDKAIKNISDAFNTSKANARRLVLTESAAMASVAEQDCYKELDVEEYEIVGTFDANMCSDCASLDGEHFPCKDFKIGVNAPPFHPNCYCTTVPYYDDMAGIGERWMRNPDTGKGEWISSDMKYDDWKDIYIDKKSTLDEWKAKHKAAATVPNGIEKGGAEKASGLLSINECKTAKDVEQLMKSGKWFAEDRVFTNDMISFEGVDFECAKAVYESFSSVFERYPQFKGKLGGFEIKELPSDIYGRGNVYGFRVTMNRHWLKDATKFAKSYAEDVEDGYHPIGTDWKSVVTHEIGHAIDGYITYKKRPFGMKSTYEPKWVSSALRPKVMKSCGMKVSAAYDEVSGYATKDHYEFFAECFAEWMDSDSPRTVSKEFGKQFEELLEEVGLK